MKIGLKRGTVELYDHDILWEENANEIINLLKKLFQNIAVDIQHIGSTSIKNIKAKPIIDIIVGINDFNLLNNLVEILKQNGVIHRPNNDKENYRFFIMGEMKNEIRTHHIHIVKYNDNEWINQINFRDYLNNNLEEAKNYEELKIELFNKYKMNRGEYTKNKENYINKINVEAKEWRENVYESNPNCT
jgi:GrpB-like predicted nucleotidyltransferase (UPF0157 family)